MPSKAWMGPQESQIGPVVCGYSNRALRMRQGLGRLELCFRMLGWGLQRPGLDLERFRWELQGPDKTWKNKGGQEKAWLEPLRSNSHLSLSRSNSGAPRPHPSLLRHYPSILGPNQAFQNSSLPRLNQASHRSIKPPKDPSRTSKGTHLNLYTW